MLAMHWLLCPFTNERTEAAGMPPGLPGYAVGRLGVLGDCPVDNVVGAAFFWEPDHMRAQVNAGRAVISPAEGAAIFTRVCQEWGQAVLGDFESVERLGELAERVVASASPLATMHAAIAVVLVRITVRAASTETPRRDITEW